MNNFDKVIGTYAKEYRKNILNLSQAEMASKLGVSRLSINNFETGRHHSYKIFNGYMSLGMPYPTMDVDIDVNFKEG